MRHYEIEMVLTDKSVWNGKVPDGKILFTAVVVMGHPVDCSSSLSNGFVKCLSFGKKRCAMNEKLVLGLARELEAV